MVGKVFVGDGQGAAAGKLIDGGAPVVEWQGGVVDELRWSKAKLLGWSGGAEQHWNDGSTAEQSSPEKKVGVAMVYAGEEARPVYL